MIARYATAAIAAVFVVTLAGCDRTKPGESGSTQGPGVAAQAERQLERAGAMVDDATITAKIKTALIAEPGLKGLAIDVDTTQNVVSLNGTVATDDLRKQAERIARGVEGVKDVKNNLGTKPTS